MAELDFDLLVTTWQLKRKQVPLDRLEAFAGVSGADQKRRSLEYEKEHGDGHYEERRLLLEDVLRKLRQRPQVDLQKTFATLVWARRVQMNVAGIWAGIARDHALRREGAIVGRQLRRWLAQTVRFYQRVREAGVSKTR